MLHLQHGNIFINYGPECPGVSFVFEEHQWMADDFQVLGGCALILLFTFYFCWKKIFFLTHTSWLWFHFPPFLQVPSHLTIQPEPPTFCHSLENKILWDDSKNMIDQELALHLDKTSKRKRAQEKAQEIVPFITHS